MLRERTYFMMKLQWMLLDKKTRITISIYIWFSTTKTTKRSRKFPKRRHWPSLQITWQKQILQKRRICFNLQNCYASTSRLLRNSRCQFKMKLYIQIYLETSISTNKIDILKGKVQAVFTSHQTNFYSKWWEHALELQISNNYGFIMNLD